MRIVPSVGVAGRLSRTSGPKRKPLRSPAVHGHVPVRSPAPPCVCTTASNPLVPLCGPLCSSLARQFKALSVAPSLATAAASRVAVVASANPQRLAVAAAPVRAMSTMLPAFGSPLLARSAAFKAKPSASVVTVQVRRKSYKLKVKASVKKRFKVNCNGLVKRAQANKRHIATKKTRERIRRLGKPVFVQGKIRKNVLDMLRK